MSDKLDIVRKRQFYCAVGLAMAISDARQKVINEHKNSTHLMNKGPSKKGKRGKELRW